jgi:hypothetical protein
MLVLLEELLVQRETTLENHETAIVRSVGQEVGDSLDAVHEASKW